MERNEARESVWKGAGRGRSLDAGRSGGDVGLLTDRPLLLEIFVAVNLAFLVADTWIAHEANDFAHAAEYVPPIFSAVAAAALAVGYLVTLFTRSVNRAFLEAGYWVLGLEAAVGVAGLALHVEPLVHASRAGLAEKFLYGAPVFAPLLFPNLALLGALGLRDLAVKRS